MEYGRRLRQIKKIPLEAGVFLFGGRGTRTDEPPKWPPNPHDIIRFFPKTKDRIFQICSPLYKQGLSIREIEKQTGIAKSTVRETLRSRGFVLRKFDGGPKSKKKMATAMRPGVIPYGYIYLEGKLVVDPREYKIVLQMLRLWRSGKSFAAIASKLNDQRVPTRLNRKWNHSVVSRIIQCHSKDKK